MSARVLSGREALQEWLLVCVNLARRSGVLTHHSNERSGAEARDWVTVTGIRPQNTVSTEEAYAMAEQLSQAFASAAIEYAKGAPDADAKLQDALLVGEAAPDADAKLQDALLVGEAARLREEVSQLKAKLALIELRAEHPQIAKYQEWQHEVMNIGYAADDAANTIKLVTETRRIDELRALVETGIVGPRCRYYLLTGGDLEGTPKGSGRVAYLEHVDELSGLNLASLAICVGMDRERSQDGMLEPDENLRARLRTWNAPQETPYAGASESVDD